MRGFSGFCARVRHTLGVQLLMTIRPAAHETPVHGLRRGLHSLRLPTEIPEAPVALSTSGPPNLLQRAPWPLRGGDSVNLRELLA